MTFSAAFATVTVNDYSLMAWDTAEFSVTASNFKIIEEFKESGLAKDDLALVILDEEIDLCHLHRVRMVALPDQHETIIPFILGKRSMCFALGWGLTESGLTAPTLRKTVLIITRVLGETGSTDWRDRHYTLAAVGHNFSTKPCEGDSGGPVLCNISGRIVQLTTQPYLMLTYVVTFTTAFF
ncbi:hypothetical protein AB6A40_004439 [Gnathostoma spinigerum]|uniref:Peptidase S1 domain-containing protein n=1 Tax=Gnathostoma spinigerum TaxID=75299 RepID=A0ABD6EN66_9BILA